MMERFWYKKLFIFDFDGVLVDSVGIKADAFEHIYTPYGPEVVQRIVKHHSDNGGMSRSEKFLYYHGKILGINVDHDLLKALSDSFSKYVLDRIIKCNEVRGVTGILDYCQEHKIICAINSAMPQEELGIILEKRGWIDYFNNWQGFPGSKIQNMNEIINCTLIDKNLAVYFGDSEIDYIAARSVKIDFVGINYFKNKPINNLCFPDFLPILENIFK